MQISRSIKLFLVRINHDQFEYLTVLVSIILALGMSEVMICWDRIIQHRDRIHFSWLHAFWTVFVLFMMIQFWWGFWNFRIITQWLLIDLLGIVTQTTLLVVGAILLIPSRHFTEEVNLEQIYFDNCRPFFLVYGVMMSGLIINDSFILGTGLYTRENAVRLVASIVGILMGFCENRRIHQGFPIASIGLMAVFLLTDIEI